MRPKVRLCLQSCMCAMLGAAQCYWTRLYIVKYKRERQEKNKITLKVQQGIRRRKSRFLKKRGMKLYYQLYRSPFTGQLKKGVVSKLFDNTATLLTPSFGNHRFEYNLVLKHPHTNMILSSFCIPKVVKSATKILKFGS